MLIESEERVRARQVRWYQSRPGTMAPPLPASSAQTASCSLQIPGSLRGATSPTRGVRSSSRWTRPSAVTISGGVADAQNVVDSLKYYANSYRIEKGQSPPRQVRREDSLQHPLLARATIHSSHRPRRGIRQDAAARSTTSISSARRYPEKVTATGSGSPVALGVLEEGYQEGHERRKGVTLAANAIIAAMRRNVYTGDNFDIAIIDKCGFREVSEQEKEKLLAQFSGRS